jgi:hypothetical protein
MHEIFALEIKADIFDHRGRLISSTPWTRANSLLKNFIKVLQLMTSQAATTITDTGNTPRNLSTHAATLAVNAGATITTHGIVIGSGNTAVSLEDYKLETQVTANVAHAIMVIQAEAVSASVYRLIISRQLTNNTGALLSIAEVGLYCTAGGTTQYFCIDRTLYAVALPSGSSVVLTYRWTISL